MAKKSKGLGGTAMKKLRDLFVLKEPPVYGHDKFEEIAPYVLSFLIVCIIMYLNR